MDLQWVEGFTISTSIDGKAAVIRANREGLLLWRTIWHHLRKRPREATYILTSTILWKRDLQI
ncbi:MAG: hypothetical protein Q4F51_10895, partial [Sarcina sp.]|nr:hypothetical protein [Sarcina sp.]